MNDRRFESKCATCDQRITTNNGGATWRHSKAPVEKHQAGAHGVMIQL